MVANLFAAGFFGATIPLTLKKLGVDPAIGSTVLLTTVTDVVGFFSFLGLGNCHIIINKGLKIIWKQTVNIEQPSSNWKYYVQDYWDIVIGIVAIVISDIYA